MLCTCMARCVLTMYTFSGTRRLIWEWAFSFYLGTELRFSTKGAKRGLYPWSHPAATHSCAFKPVNQYEGVPLCVCVSYLLMPCQCTHQSSHCFSLSTPCQPLPIKRFMKVRSLQTCKSLKEMMLSIQLMRHRKANCLKDTQAMNPGASASQGVMPTLCHHSGSEQVVLRFLVPRRPLPCSSATS